MMHKKKSSKKNPLKNSLKNSLKSKKRLLKKSSKQIGLQIEGVVSQCLSNGMFRILLENGFVAIAHISGKIRRYSIRILLGDNVIVELSPYDLSRGRIIYRLPPKKKK